MRYAIVDHFRDATGLPWLPGGVAVVSASGPSPVRYVAGDAAAEAAARFRAEVEMIDNGIAYGTDPFEVISRIIRSGFSGYLSWQVVIGIDDDVTIQALFDHYVTVGSQDLIPGGSALEPLLFPLG